MMKATPTALDRKWWFAALLGFLTGLLTPQILRRAGLFPPQNWAQWLAYFLCFAVIWWCLSRIGRLVLLLRARRSKLLDPPER